jgi:hypothetical protein
MRSREILHTPLLHNPLTFLQSREAHPTCWTRLILREFQLYSACIIKTTTYLLPSELGAHASRISRFCLSLTLTLARFFAHRHKSSTTPKAVRASAPTPRAPTRTQTEDLCYKRSSSALSNTLTTRERSKRVGQGRSPVLQRPRNALRAPSQPDRRRRSWHSSAAEDARHSPAPRACGLCHPNSGNARRAWFDHTR